MRVAMIPYAVDKNNIPLSFVPKWVNALARRVERLHVVTPYEGKHAPFPENVTVYSLRKDRGLSKFSRLTLLYKTLWDILHNEGLDVCFVHMHTAMTPIIWPLLHVHGVPIISWYAHGHVDKTIPLTHRLSKAIVTSSPEAYKYRADEKVHYIGQGIDEDFFFPTPKVEKQGILALGRISPIKGLDTLLTAVAILRDKNVHIPCKIVGNIPEEHTTYGELLKRRIKTLQLENLVSILPPVSNTEASTLFNAAYIYVNCSPTQHSMDKAILEAAFCGTPALTSVNALRETYGDLAKLLLFCEGNAQELAQKILEFPRGETPEYKKLRLDLQHRVQKHSLTAFIERLVSVFGDCISKRHI